MSRSVAQSRYFAKTLHGLEELLATELISLGAEDVQIAKRGVSFSGGPELLYRANYECRLALKIMLYITEGTVKGQNDLYDLVGSVDWSAWMNVHHTMAIDSVINQSVFNNSMFVSVKAKDAIADQFRDKYGMRPSVDTNFPHLRLQVHIFKDRCTLWADTSGESLHQRGYRLSAGPAPMNEVLAAGIIQLTGWDKQVPFLNPMCGSGTFLAEAAMLAYDIPAGYFRKDFAFERWPFFEKKSWLEYEGKQRDKVFRDKKVSISGFDNDRRMLEMAKENLKTSQLLRLIDLEFGDMEEYEPRTEPGVMVINPPYGERLRPDDLSALYKMMGQRFKHVYKGWKAWIITPSKEGAEGVGLKAGKKFTLFNGSLECKLLGYEMYEGSRKQKQES